MAVLRPLKVVIENYPEGEGEELEALNHPDDPAAGTRRMPFGRELFIERDDFMENPPKKFFRLSPGARGAAALCLFHHLPRGREGRGRRGGRAALHLRSRDPGGNAPDGRKVKATLHWVSAAHAVPAEVRLYNPLFTRPDPGADRRFRRRNKSELAGSDRRRAGRAGLGGTQCRRRRAVRAPGLFLPPTRIRRRSGWCLIAPSACATPGRRCPPAARPEVSDRGYINRADFALEL